MKEEPSPQFAAGGPDADAYGVAAGYPLGDRATFFNTRSLVGSLSHLDEIFLGRLVRKAPGALAAQPCCGTAHNVDL